MVHSTEEIVIRLATPADAMAVREIYSPFCEESAVSFEETTPATEEMIRRIQTALERFPWLICELGRELVGYAYAGKHRERTAYRWSVDVSLYVKDGRRRCGIGRALYRSLTRALTLQGYYHAYAGITLPNPASVGLHEAIGFKPVGVYRSVGYKLGAWHDVGWWQLELQSPESAPTEPRPLPQVLVSSEWAAISVGTGAP
jgi:phosphinothricin acetyltransferase